ncbi:hypothetical protein AgCh_029145 [Apium graveolens]
MGVLIKGSCYDDTAIDYYGHLEEVLVLSYSEVNKVVLFKCHWFVNRRGIKVDKNKFITVDMTSKLRGNDVFVLASQATEVYYATIVKNLRSKMHIIVVTRSRPVDETTYANNENVFEEEPLEDRPVELPSIDLFWILLDMKIEQSMSHMKKNSKKIIKVKRVKVKRVQVKMMVMMTSKLICASTRRSVIEHMADDLVMQEVDRTIAFARAHPDQFDLAPEQVNILAQSVAAGGKGISCESGHHSDEDDNGDLSRSPRQSRSRTGNSNGIWIRVRDIDTEIT